MNSNIFKTVIALLMKLAIPFSILLITLIWSLHLFVELGSDFGFYYATSYFLSDEYLLYKEAFTHKGPLYFIFIKSIGGIIGWGYIQSYVTLVITALCFYLPIIYILYKKAYKNTNKFIIIFISIALLYKQDTNLSISLLQSGLLIMSFYFLLESLRNVNGNFYVFSVVFFALAVLVRIDAAVYSPAFLVALIFMYQNDIKVISILKIAVTSIIGLVLPFIACLYYLDFSLQDFVIHNVDFNAYYKNDNLIKMIFRPLHFSLLMSNGLILFFLYLIVYLTTDPPFFSLKNNFKKFNLDRAQFLLAILLIVLGFILWIISHSDTNYHVFFIVTPLVFFISFFGGVKDISTKVFLLALPILLYVVMLTVSDGLRVILKKPQCINNYLCQESDAYSYMKTIDGMKNKENPSIIGGIGWLYFFSDTKPKGPINNWFLYQRQIPFITKAQLDAHNELINQPSGYEFWIYTDFLNGDERSKYLKQILTISSPVYDEGDWTRYKIK